MYKEKVKITSVDVDSNLEIRLSNLFKHFQEVASNHVDTLKLGHRDLMNQNLLWVVIRMEVVIYRTPSLDEEVLFTTHPGETKSFIFPRYFEVYDKKGKLIIAVSSSWALIDKNTRKVVLKPESMVKIKGEKDKNDLELPAKVVGDATNLVEEKSVKYTEIDLNGHLNNTSYIEYILNTHDEAFYKSHRIKRININYDKEIRSGDKVSLYTNNSFPEIIKGKVGDVNHFTAELEYEER